MVRWLAGIGFVLAVAGLAWGQAHILTESGSGDCLNAENADRITTEGVETPGDCVAGAPACPKTLATLGAGC